MIAPKTSVGQYLAKRLESIGIRHYFAIPGDYNLVLLDELLENKQLKPIYCCNELNAGYAADGYTRANGISALVVTYTVGGLSAINAIAGAYAEDLPIIVVSGGPNSNSAAEKELLHHSLGEPDYHYMREMYQKVTANSVIIRHLNRAPEQIDEAIRLALHYRKPVYLEIACNIAGLTISAPNPINFEVNRKSDSASLEAAVKHAAAALNQAVKPVMVAGSKLRSWDAIEAFANLANKARYAIATMPDAKGFIDESSDLYIGTYWGSVSSPGCGEIIESSDLYLYAGPRFTDYTTVGYTALINEKKLIAAHPRGVSVLGQYYGNVFLHDFLFELSKHVEPNSTSREAFERVRSEVIAKQNSDKSAPLSRQALFTHIQNMLDEKTSILVETGDSWFNGLELKLPKGCAFEIQMQYGSIGWSVGAALGYACSQAEKHQVIGLIGDGSFQMTAQEVSSMIRYQVPLTIFLINNDGYVIEVEIHDGPYNVLNRWDYAKLVEVFDPESKYSQHFKVTNEMELSQAITKAKDFPGLNFIEVILARSDCNKNLLKWGSAVAHNNGRPPTGKAF